MFHGTNHTPMYYGVKNFFLRIKIVTKHEMRGGNKRVSLSLMQEPKYLKTKFHLLSSLSLRDKNKFLVPWYTNHSYIFVNTVSAWIFANEP